MSVDRNVTLIYYSMYPANIFGRFKAVNLKQIFEHSALIICFNYTALNLL